MKRRKSRLPTISCELCATHCEQEVYHLGGLVVKCPSREREIWGLSPSVLGRLSHVSDLTKWHSSGYLAMHLVLLGWFLFYSILFYSRLCPSTAGSSPPPESSIFLCPLLSSSTPLLVAPQCHLSNDVLVFRLILHPLSASGWFALCHILWVRETGSLICNFCFSVTARRIVFTDPSLTHCMVLGRDATR